MKATVPKYGVNEVDNKIKPGIEVLKGKYFLRDDGKSVELTHDVLVPLIKTDRENRRKGIALGIAKQKAKRRALRIIILSAAGALLIWFIGTYKAFKDRDHAQTEKNYLDSQIVKLKSDSTILADANKKKPSKPKDSKNPKGIDSSNVVSQVNNNNDSLKIVKDSLQNLYNVLQIKYNQLSLGRAALENNITDLNNKINDITGNQSKTESANNELQRYIVDLRKQKYSDSIKFINLYDLLRREFNAYKLKYPEPFPPPIPPKPVVEVNSLKLDLHYAGSKVKVPANLNIYLIPYNSANKVIIRNAQLYEISCDDAKLKQAKDKRIATYINGMYSFNNVAPGKYLIKICDYYGRYYPYTKRTGMDTVRWDASPPIR